MNGPPAKPTTARSPVELGADEPDGLEHERHGLLGLGDAQPLDVGEARDRAATTGPTPSTSSTSTPMPRTGSMMSANITAASTPWRRTGCSVTSAQSSGLPADLEEVVALADLPVLGQRAPGLAHEPDRRALDVLAPAARVSRGSATPEI